MILPTKSNIYWQSKKTMRGNKATFVFFPLLPDRARVILNCLPI